MSSGDNRIGLSNKQVIIWVSICVYWQWTIVKLSYYEQSYCQERRPAAPAVIIEDFHTQELFHNHSQVWRPTYTL